MTFAILPIKRFDRAKQRLGEASPDKAALAAAMADSVIVALVTSERVDVVLVVTADGEARCAALRHGAEVVDEPVVAGHRAAAELGIARAIEADATRALLVPGDCPLLAADEVDALLDRHERSGVVVIPDRHGTGTNALLLQPPDAIKPAFGPGSRDRHMRLAVAAGLPAVVDEVPGLLLDIDTPEDLVALERRVGRVPATGARQGLLARVRMESET
jgi:2-phospho-L-lactate guanylyltransferase